MERNFNGVQLESREMIDKTRKDSAVLKQRMLASCAFGFLLIASSSVQAGILDCSKDEGVSRLGCWIMKAAIVGAGSVAVAGSELSSAIAPGVDVIVNAPGVEPFPGKLAQKVASGRTVKEGDVIGLVCKVNKTPYQGEYGYASCEMTFPKQKPRPSSHDYYQREGLQPTYGFGANSLGELTPGLLKVDQPVPLTLEP
jgi:hypothetical protein